MKVVKFIAVIVLSSVFFLFFTMLDDLYVTDRGEEQIIESILLAILLSVIGVVASRHYSDTTTIATIEELKKLQSEFEKKIKNLESKLDNIQKSKDDKQNGGLDN